MRSALGSLVLRTNQTHQQLQEQEGVGRVNRCDFVVQVEGRTL